MEIRPISDLRNHFLEIENLVIDGQPVFLTRNGYGSMVLMSLEDYTTLTDQKEQDLPVRKKSGKS